MYQTPNVGSQLSNTSNNIEYNNNISTSKQYAIGDQFQVQQQSGIQRIVESAAADSSVDSSISFTFDEIDPIISSKNFQDLVRNEKQQQQTFGGAILPVGNNLLQTQREVEDEGSAFSRRHNFVNQQAIISSDENCNCNCNNNNNYEDDDEKQLKESIYEEIKESLSADKSGDHIMATTNNNNRANNNNNNLSSKNYLANVFDNKSRPHVEIVEQPAKCSLRFRYKCEGRSAGSLPGVNSSADNKTYPSIRINNYVGRAVVVISCVTSDAPYRAHPHNIVGKEGCKKGICTIVVNNEPNMVRTFSSLGIQCVKRRDIEESLSLRESINVDPFRNGFAHKLCASNIDLNVVRLCFQVFIEGATQNKCDVPLTPMVSEPIHDKKAMSDLVITKLSHCSAPATGGREVILLCDRIAKDDTQIRFYEERDGKLIWENYSELSPADVHKQVAICFRTPKYYNENITQPVMVKIQLKRVSDNQVSEPRLFQFLPCESDEDIISRKRQKIEWVNMNHYALDNILQPPNQYQQLQFHATQQQSLGQQQAHQNQDLQHRSCLIEHQQQQHLNLNLNHLHHQQQQNQRLLSEAPRSPMQPQRTSPLPLTHQQHHHQQHHHQQQHQQQQQQQQHHHHHQHHQQPNQAAVAVPSGSSAPGSARVSPIPTPSPTTTAQQQQHQQQNQNQHQNRIMIDSQNLVVRREIIDDEGKVMRLVDRPTTCQQHTMDTPNLAGPNNKPLASSLDRIDTAELMRDMTFNSNIDLNALLREP